MKLSQIKNKVKSKIADFDEETIAYIQMLLITYVITIVMTVVCLILLFDNNSIDKLQFSRCKNVDQFLYSMSCVVQTLVPTTITFSGTIIILQSKFNKIGTMKVLLFITIILLAVFGILQISAQTFSILYIANVMLILLNAFALFFSKKVFYLPAEDINVSKCEVSDCKPIS